ERVAEVAARFTLDAMPGKQMSIDADLRNQMVTPEQAKERRGNLERESKLYGAMDGAMKFVKGDAIAGIIIALVNIIGGMIIGVMQLGMPAAEAAQTYSLLTIGDGLVSQIPALLVCVSAGLIVTRVAAQGDSATGAQGHVAKDIVEQMLANPKSIAVLSIVLFFTGLVPGFPKVPFWSLAAIAGIMSFPRLSKARLAAAAATTAARAAAPGKPGESGATVPATGAPADAAEDRGQLPRRLFPVPVILELGKDLERLFTTADGNALPDTRRALDESVRAMLSDQAGIPFPPVSLRIDVSHLRGNEYAILLFDAPVARGMASPTHAMALCDVATANSKGIEATQVRIPWSRAGACAIAATDAPQAQDAGIRTLAADRLILMHLMVVLRRNSADFLGIQELSHLVDRLKQDRPDLVKALIPTQLTLQQTTEVVKQLLRERVPVRDLRLVFESIARYAGQSKEPLALAELVRPDLKRQLCARYASPLGVLSYYAVHPEIERMIQDALIDTPSGPQAALGYDEQQRLIAGFERAIDPRRHLTNEAVVLVASAQVRRYLARAMEHIFPDVVFVAFQELAPEAIPDQAGIVVLVDPE
ncbi:MAG: FHIPEP family type III secretion protein, partial [Phycisphaerae bacterium]